MTKQAIVTKSTGSFYELLFENTVITARIRGKIKLDNRRTTNPISVGDWVDFIRTDDDFMITKIYPRKNYLIRKSVNLSKETHIIASNIDLACFVFTYNEPSTSLGFLDRFLVTCEAYQIKPLIIINKIDIYSEKDLQIIENIISEYQKIGYSFIKVSAKNKDNIIELQSKITNLISVFFGHSGSGKSTLVNALDSNFNLKIGDISAFSDKGQHTTTFAQMYTWDFGGYIIDTPGIKEFGVVDMHKDELQDYFPDIFVLKGKCKFHNCLHLNEPYCAVKGAIRESRYNSYVKLMDEIV